MTTFFGPLLETRKRKNVHVQTPTRILVFSARQFTCPMWKLKKEGKFVD